MLLAVDLSREGQEHLQGVEIGSHPPILLCPTTNYVSGLQRGEYSHITGFGGGPRHRAHYWS